MKEAEILQIISEIKNLDEREQNTIINLISRIVGTRKMEKEIGEKLNTTDMNIEVSSNQLLQELQDIANERSGI